MSLKPFTGLAEDEHGEATGPKFKLKGDILYCHGDERGPFRAIVMELAPATAWGGHLGQNKTWDRVVDCFYWPNTRLPERLVCQSGFQVIRHHSAGPF